jgi:hypothetical protein
MESGKEKCACRPRKLIIAVSFRVLFGHLTPPSQSKIAFEPLPPLRVRLFSCHDGILARQSYQIVGRDSLTIVLSIIGERQNSLE